MKRVKKLKRWLDSCWLLGITHLHDIIITLAFTQSPQLLALHLQPQWASWGYWDWAPSLLWSPLHKTATRWPTHVRSVCSHPPGWASKITLFSAAAAHPLVPLSPLGTYLRVFKVIIIPDYVVLDVGHLASHRVQVSPVRAFSHQCVLSTNSVLDMSQKFTEHWWLNRMSKCHDFCNMLLAVVMLQVCVSSNHWSARHWQSTPRR